MKDGRVRLRKEKNEYIETDKEETGMKNEDRKKRKQKRKRKQRRTGIGKKGSTESIEKERD